MKAHRGAHLVGKLVDVPGVTVRNDHVADLVAVRGDRFLLETANGQHSAPQRDLARHRHITTHWYARQRADHSSGDRDARRWTILWCRTSGHVDVDVSGPVELRLDPQWARAS